MEDRAIKIRLETYQELRKNFKPFENETIICYFSRLSKHLEKLQELNKSRKL